MPALLCGIILVFLLAGALSVYLVWRSLQRYYLARQACQLLLLENYQRRLKVIVDSLLKRADDIDLASKYVEAGKTDEWQSSLGKVCSELVVLGESVNTLESLLQSKDIRRSRSVLLSSCKLAGKILRELQETQNLVAIEPGFLLEPEQRNLLEDTR